MRPRYCFWAISESAYLLFKHLWHGMAWVWHHHVVQELRLDEGPLCWLNHIISCTSTSQFPRLDNGKTQMTSGALSFFNWRCLESFCVKIWFT